MLMVQLGVFVELGLVKEMLRCLSLSQYQGSKRG
jgi:hypothetical protein